MSLLHIFPTLYSAIQPGKSRHLLYIIQTKQVDSTKTAFSLISVYTRHVEPVVPVAAQTLSVQ